MTAQSLAALCKMGNGEIIKKADNGAYLLQGLIAEVKAKYTDIDLDYLLAILDIAEDIYLQMGNNGLMEHGRALGELDKAIKKEAANNAK